VTLRVLLEDQRLMIEVKDTGIGISPEYVPKVSMFFRRKS
jgi:signal transduction histidine kinase